MEAIAASNDHTCFVANGRISCAAEDLDVLPIDQ